MVGKWGLAIYRRCAFWLKLEVHASGNPSLGRQVSVVAELTCINGGEHNQSYGLTVSRYRQIMGLTTTS